MTKTFKDFVSDENKKMAAITDILVRDCKKWLTETNCFPVYRGMFHERDKRSIEQLLPHSQSIDHKSEVDISESIFMLKVNKQRKPTDSPQWLHDALNENIEAKTGIAFRSKSVFVVPSADIASNYGMPYIVFPIGDYDYAWSTILLDAMYDLYGWLDIDGRQYDKWEDVIRQKPKIGVMFRDAWKRYLKDNPKKVKQGFTQDFESFRDVAEDATHFNIQRDVIQNVIENNSLWEFNTGLLDVITTPMYHDHEIMVSTDFYYAVPASTKNDSTLVKELRRKLQNA